ncbi:HAMP domain-containing sensor histidine kinase [Bacillus sp. ISL-37]|jgi:signal transduction histidine kinase|uniref:sensor histidine kinase n=1 Tax=Bacillus sp. ISL-37 TaxID=2819123 RepID=UPI001BEBE35D|nr:HAMP domain-containing sensor histidine kinase [Bacillus sp. ISL-37]MBT2684984.1 HAMP domain-containing protein [Bacillus sp. ISL-37]
MRWGLKPRLILAFISIIIVPIAAAILFMTFYSAGMEERTGRSEDELDVLLTETKEIINENAEHLEDPDLFYEKVRPLMQKYQIGLTVYSSEGETLFNSSGYQKRQEESIWLDRFGKLNVDVLTQEQGELSAEIQAHSLTVPPFSQFKEMTYAILGAIGIGLAVLLALILLWTWYISKTILQPLKEIYHATEEVIEGNLDYKIRYGKQDEIGRFIHGFDLMREHLKKSVEQQQQYERARKQLIASISHDLRTPLASIKGYVEGLEDGIAKNEEMQKKYYSVIKSKTNQLDRLIEDLFEFSKFELEQLSIDKNLVNSREFFQETFHSAQLDYQGVELVLADPLPSISLQIDSDRIKQVMANLVDNAVKYGGTNILLKVETQGGYLQIIIKDNGQGIAEEDLPLIFNPFFRGEKSRSRESGGTGLGLAIVKYIVNAHGGEIRAVSEKGKGSEFIFTLPLYLKHGK